MRSLGVSLSNCELEINFCSIFGQWVAFHHPPTLNLPLDSCMIDNNISRSEKAPSSSCMCLNPANSKVDYFKQSLPYLLRYGNSWLIYKVAKRSVWIILNSSTFPLQIFFELLLSGRTIQDCSNLKRGSFPLFFFFI